MPSANRCPECRATIHPFGATCESCGADLDAHRRRQREQATRRPALEVPQMTHDQIEFTAVTVILVLLALFAPLFGALFAAVVTYHANQNGYLVRRNVAIFCLLLGLFLLVTNYAPVPQVSI